MRLITAVLLLNTVVLWVFIFAHDPTFSTVTSAMLNIIGLTLLVSADKSRA